MAFSESSATMHFYAMQLEKLRSCKIPREMVWTKHTQHGTLSLCVITFEGPKYFDRECQYNFYGDRNIPNIAFFFRVDDGHPYRWKVTIHDRDTLNLPVEWTLDTPSEWRWGFPEDVQVALREIVEEVFHYAKSTLGYQPTLIDEKLTAFFDSIPDMVSAARDNRS